MHRTPPAAYAAVDEPPDLEAIAVLLDKQTIILNSVTSHKKC